MRARNSKTNKGIVSLHPTEGTNLFAILKENLDDSCCYPPTKTLAEVFIEKNRERVFSRKTNSRELRALILISD